MLVMGKGMLGKCCRHGHASALRFVEWQQRILFEAAPPSLPPLGQIQGRKQDGEHQADQDGDCENFHRGLRSFRLSLTSQKRRLPPVAPPPLVMPHPILC